MKHYFPNTDALVYVIDSTDIERFDECKEELWRVLKEPELPETTLLLVMANKQDVSTAVSTEEIAKRFELDKISDRTWRKYNLLL